MPERTYTKVLRLNHKCEGGGKLIYGLWIKFCRKQKYK